MECRPQIGRSGATLPLPIATQSQGKGAIAGPPPARGARRAGEPCDGSEPHRIRVRACRPTRASRAVCRGGGVDAAPSRCWFSGRSSSRERASGPYATQRFRLIVERSREIDPSARTASYRRHGTDHPTSGGPCHSGGGCCREGRRQLGRTRCPASAGSRGPGASPGCCAVPHVPRASFSRLTPSAGFRFHEGIGPLPTAGRRSRPSNPKALGHAYGGHRHSTRLT